MPDIPIRKTFIIYLQLYNQLIEHAGLAHRRSTVACADCDKGVSGKRSTFSSCPCAPPPLYRNRIGFDKQVAVQTSRRKFISRALATSPFSAAAHISRTSFGATFAVTEIVPCAPSSINAAYSHRRRCKRRNPMSALQ